MVEGSNNRSYAHRPMVSPYLTGIKPPLHSTSKCHKSVTCSCVSMFVQLNKCVVCGSVLQRGHCGDGCLTSSILFKYERSREHLFVLSWARV